MARLILEVCRASRFLTMGEPPMMSDGSAPAYDFSRPQTALQHDITAWIAKLSLAACCLERLRRFRSKTTAAFDSYRPERPSAV